MKACFIYRNFLTYNGSCLSVGGIQTYIYNLQKIFHECGYDIEVYQVADHSFERIYDSIKVFGISVPRGVRKVPEYLFGECKKKLNANNDIVIFGCETFACDCKGYKSIGIQHGITWDQRWEKSKNNTLYNIYYFHKAIKGWKTIKRVSKVQKLICVDRNFVNWYRASVAYPKLDISVIPNFTEIPDSRVGKQFKAEKINIIFARRFAVYRGTRVFTHAIERILREFNNVEVTIAGEGEDSSWLHNHLDVFENVRFLKYESKDALSIHADKHIAVIPTIGSEGTSLSLLEAMASSCAVVCTDVGGLTDVVINDYNGKMVEAGDPETLYQAMKELISDEDKRVKLASKAYETVSEAFSYEKWKHSWIMAIQSIEKE